MGTNTNREIQMATSIYKPLVLGVLIFLMWLSSSPSSCAFASDNEVLAGDGGYALSFSAQRADLVSFRMPEDGSFHNLTIECFIRVSDVFQSGVS